MKKAMTLLLCAVALAGCSKSERPEIPGTDPGIRLQAGLSAVSKAPVNTGDDFTAAVAGWETASAVNYGTAPSWLSTASVTASASVSALTLVPAQTYRQEVTVKTYMKAWHPAGTLSDDGKVTFGGTPDGTTDVLLCAAVTGAANDADPKTLVFAHPLTQLKFTVKANSTFGTTTTLSSLTLKNGQLPTGIDLAADAVLYGTPGLIGIPGITPGATFINATDTPAGKPLMVKPFAGNTFKLDVVTSVTTYRDVSVTIDDNKFVPGRAYTVTLTFGGVDISVGSAVDEWTTGTGSGQIID